MKSKQSINKKSKRSAFNEFDDKSGLRPLKSNSGKSKKISIYDDLDDDFDDLDYKNFLHDIEDDDFGYEDDE